MKLSASNIGWNQENNEKILKELKKNGFDAIEIAPTILIKENPYDKLEEIKEIYGNLKNTYGLEISSMQSIWFGKQGNIFNKEDAEMFIEYTKKAINFANIAEIGNLVFGCPKNRIKPDGFYEDDIIYFFKEIGDYAETKNTVVALEPNPTIYGTNFINYTNQAFEFAKKVNSNGIKVNVDFGTIIQNNENLDIIENNINLVNHVHISEPNLVKVEKREKHKELCDILKKHNYNNYVSIEMKQTENITDMVETIEYVKEIFG